MLDTPFENLFISHNDREGYIDRGAAGMKK